MRTDTDALPVPEWLAVASSEGFDSAIRVNTQWWERVLSQAGLEAELPPSVDGRLKRSDIFHLASRCTDDPEVARAVLWASLAWGEGTRAFRNPGRVRSFLMDRDRNSDLLVQAADISLSDPEAAYQALFRQIKHLGPAFFTKFLYFAGGGNASHPCLILDARVAAALKYHSGWDSLDARAGWPADTYGRYCELLARWAGEVDQRGIPISADQLEFRLFSRR
ncbi:8-oxoguanine DNA glycosylase OGG fold protein [Rhodococcoides fascians]|uniref:8-oxoguanine DNA glycosylase OGG fold protein n=1 Tax=Rhodococcoides fascians TaxID=1828 RepID=UPI003263732F